MVAPGCQPSDSSAGWGEAFLWADSHPARLARDPLFFGGNAGALACPPLHWGAESLPQVHSSSESLRGPLNSEFFVRPSWARIGIWPSLLLATPEIS